MRLSGGVGKIFRAILVAGFFTTELWAQDTAKPAHPQIAALALPTAAWANWQQWDSFLTKELFHITPDALRGAARLLGAGERDLLAYAVNVGSGLCGLLGFTSELPQLRPGPGPE